MPDHRDNRSQPAEANFSIETTTMRLKLLKVRRAEAADKALDAHLREQSRGGRPEPVASPESHGPAGRVRHDDRGMAVWDWAAASGETAGLSATNVMRKLDVSGLSIEQTQRELKAMEVAPAGDAGFDPYNQRSGTSGDPYQRALKTGDPYNRGNLQRPAPGMQRPAPKPAAPVKKPGGSVLDQLTGKKK